MHFQLIFKASQLKHVPYQEGDEHELTWRPPILKQSVAFDASKTDVEVRFLQSRDRSNAFGNSYRNVLVWFS